MLRYETHGGTLRPKSVVHQKLRKGKLWRQFVELVKAASASLDFIALKATSTDKRVV